MLFVFQFYKINRYLEKFKRREFKAAYFPSSEASAFKPLSVKFVLLIINYIRKKRN